MTRPITLVEHLRRAGSVRSAKKARASRRNAKLGGKPPKFEKGDRVRVLEAEGAPAKRIGTTGRIVGPAKSRSHYEVAFEDKTVALPSWWLANAR